MFSNDNLRAFGRLRSRAAGFSRVCCFEEFNANRGRSDVRMHVQVSGERIVEVRSLVCKDIATGRKSGVIRKIE